MNYHDFGNCYDCLLEKNIWPNLCNLELPVKTFTNRILRVTILLSCTKYLSLKIILSWKIDLIEQLISLKHQYLLPLRKSPLSSILKM